MTTTTELVQYPAVSKQASLEARMVQEGIDSFFKKQEKAHDKGELAKAEQDVVQAYLSQVADGITKMLNAYVEAKESTGKAGKTPGWVLPVSLIDSKVLAYASLKHCFHSIAKAYDTRKLFIQLGKAIEMEIWAKALYIHDPKLFDRLCKMAIKNNASYKQRKDAVTATARKEDFPYIEWDDNYCAGIGCALVNAVLLSTNLFEVYGVEEGTREEHKLLCLTEEAKEALGTLNMEYALLRPKFLPTLTPPKPWVSPHTGCYEDVRLSCRVPFVKVFDKTHKRKLKEAFEDGSIKPVVDAVNSIQAVPLRINVAVLSALSYCWENNVVVEGLPEHDYFPLPGRVHPVRWRIMPEEEKRRFKKMKQNIILKNRGLESEWLQFNQDLGLAKEFSCEPEFYLPHFLDFRGRVYPVPPFNHQRSDHVRALFEFAKGKPLGDSGAYWLAIHIANCGDFDKISKGSFKERYQWVLDNSDWIEEIGHDPLGTIDKWSAADKPFSFLAGCCEWAGFKQEGTGFVSHLPIALDGSNSGLQHYSAALRSPEGALVNLTPSEKPQDVYGAVAAICADTVEKDLSNPELSSVAQMWKEYGVTRSVVKRSVMTFAYSSEKYGFKQQLIDDLMEPLKDKVLKQELEKHPFGNDGGKEAAGYMAGLIWDGVNSVVTKAAKGMKYLQKAAGALAHEAKPVTWVTPMGLPVVNIYQEYEVKEVELFLFDRKVKVSEASDKDKVTKDGNVLKRVRMNIRVKPTGKILKPKMKSTVSPNFIHSLDGAHLQATVNAAVAEGITDLLLIHDSFSTHACNTGVFQGIIKKAFVDMYETNDVFAQFHEKALEALSEENRDKLDDVPEKGTLDIQDVLKSDYCFS